MVNKIYCGDCLFVMRHDLLERGIKVDLIYLDPPFFTGKVQKGTWQPEAMEVSYEDSKKFWGTKTATGAPTWIKEVGSKRPAFAAYLEYMRKRLEFCKRLLKDTGSIYLHCDHRASHYLKMVLDGVFGADNFRNEIVWCYTGASSPGQKQFPRKHDTIFWYSQGNKWIFNADAVRVPYSKSTLQRAKAGEAGGRSAESVFHGKRTKRKLHTKGKISEDWWKIPIVGSTAKERVGYPTQKPLVLLERIIKASSKEGDIILDPFCGCGTAIVAAHKLNRKWIGIDLNPQACKVMVKRFEDQFSITPELHMRTVDEVKKLKPNQFEVWVNEFYQAKKPMPDKGVDGITPEGWPIQTKTFKVKYNTVSAFLSNMRFHQDVPKPVKFGIIASQKGFDESAISRVFLIKERENITIKLVTPEDLLKVTNVSKEAEG